MTTTMATKKKPVSPFPYDPSALLPYGLDRLWKGMYEAPPQWFQDIPQLRVETPYRKSVVITQRIGDTRLLTWRGINRTDDTNNAFLTVEWKPGDKGAIVAIALAQARLVLRRKKDLRYDDKTAAIERVLIADSEMGEADAIETAAAVAFLANSLLKQLRTKGGSCAALGADLDRRKERLERLLSGEDLRTTRDKKTGWNPVEWQVLTVIVEAIRSMMDPERKPPHTRPEITDRVNDLFRSKKGSILESKDTGKVLKRLGLDWI